MFCINDTCYIKPNSSSIQQNWRAAQQECNKYGSTLPIVSDLVQQESFEAACRNLELLESSNDQNAEIWIGAKAFQSDPINWMWLDESIYNGTGTSVRSWEKINRHNKPQEWNS